jgi:hypothetical protein
MLSSAPEIEMNQRIMPDVVLIDSHPMSAEWGCEMNLSPTFPYGYLCRNWAKL